MHQISGHGILYVQLSRGDHLIKGVKHLLIPSGALCISMGCMEAVLGLLTVMQTTSTCPLSLSKSTFAAVQRTKVSGTATHTHHARPEKAGVDMLKHRPSSS